MEESGSEQDPSDRVDFLFVYFNIASCYLILGSMAIPSEIFPGISQSSDWGKLWDLCE